MLNDLRYAFRTLRRSPGFAVSAIVALALGIGANTAVFSVVYAVLWKPLPYESPERLVRLREANRGEGIAPGDVSAGTFVDWRARSRTLESLAGYSIPFAGETLWTIGDRVQVVKTSVVSPGLFALLRVQPIVGRPLRPEEEAAPPGAMGQFLISDGLWRRVFGGAADVVGRTIMIEGRLPREIVGVMPPGFAFPEGTDAWTSMPLASVPVAQRRARSFEVIARLTAAATVDDARREIDGISAQLGSEQPASNAGWTAEVGPLTGSDTATAKPALLALLAAVAGVLFIGCASVANLLLARATARRHEMAVRLALGAGTPRLVRQCVADALILCLLGTAAGLVLGQWLAAVLVGLAPPDIPRLAGAAVSGPLFLFAASAGLLSTAFIGLAPSLQAARAERHGGLRPDLRSATSRSARVRRLLIAGEVAVVVLLLTGALLLLRTFVKLRGVDLGFQPQHVLSVDTRWPVGWILPNGPVRPWPRLQHAVDGLLAAVESIPGVAAAGLMSDVPLTGDPYGGTVWRAGAPGATTKTPPPGGRDRWKADLSIVTAGYFPAMGIPVVRGRNFAAADRFSDEQLISAALPRSGVVVVNSAFASRYFPNENPIGQVLVVYDDQEFSPVRTIVGVVADVRGRAISEAPVPAVYIPHTQHADVFRPRLAVRSTLPATVIAGAIRQRIAAFDPHLLVQRIRPMDDIVSGALSRPRFNLVLLVSFAAVALGLAAVGIYGVVAFLVTERTREIGIRMALGARTADVLRLVLAEGMAPVAAGGAIGVVAALAATRMLRSMLFGVTALDPVSFAAAPAVLATVALLACYLPARRATRVDPLVALRDE